MIWLGRTQEQLWLDRARQMGSLGLVYGLEGVGKRSLVWNWLQKRQLKYHWHVVDSLQNLEELQKPYLEVPRALSDPPDVVVWSGMECLDSQYREAFLRKIVSRPGCCFHLFILNRKDLVHHGIRVPELMVPPLSGQDLDELISCLNPELNDQQKLRVKNETGGLPLYIHLWMQKEEGSSLFEPTFFKNLSPKERDVLSYLVMADRVVPRVELIKAFGEVEIELRELQSRMVIDSFDHSSLKVPGFVKTLFHSGLTGSQEISLQRLYFSKRHQWTHKEPLRELYHGVRAEQWKDLKSIVGRVSIQSLSGIGELTRQELIEGLRRWPLNQLDGDQETLVSRLLLRLYSQQGRKKEGIAQVKALADKRISASFLSPQDQWFLIEYLQILNQIHKYHEVNQLMGSVQRFIEAELMPYLLMEQALSLAESKPGRAVDILSQAQKLLASMVSKKEENQVLAAKIYFEKARLLDQGNYFETAAETYEKAINLLSQQGEHYFQTMAQLNLAWVYLKLQNWSQMHESLKELTNLCDCYGYPYPRAGGHLVRSSYLRLSLRLGEALSELQKGRYLLGSQAPLPAQVDFWIEEITILCLMGLFRQGREALHCLEKLLSKNPLESKTEDMRALKLQWPRLENPQWEPEDIGESHAPSWRHCDFQSIATWLVAEPEPDVVVQLESYPLGRLRALEHRLIQTMNNEKEQSWSIFRELDELLSSVPDAMAEKVATKLLQGHLEKDENLRQNSLREAQIELDRWSGDNAAKFPLQAWIDGFVKGVSPDESTKWKKALPEDQKRWRGWWQRFFQCPKMMFQVISLWGERQVEDPAELTTTLNVREDQGEVLWQGKLVKELSRRHHLRWLLSVLLEASPQSLSKESMAQLVWNESYDPRIHDPRIYTAVQRLRSLLGSHDAIQTARGGYQWNRSIDFSLVKPTEARHQQVRRTQALIVKAFLIQRDEGERWLSRSQLLTQVDGSEASLKRHLCQLVNQGILHRKGQGRGVKYALS